MNLTLDRKAAVLFALVAVLYIGTGFVQSWNTALSILNMGLISAIMALGVNIQWGYAGLFNVGVMGFTALGGLAAVLVASDPVEGAWGGHRRMANLACPVNGRRNHCRRDCAMGQDERSQIARPCDGGLVNRGLFHLPRGV
jgi:hypothetical protein